MTIIYGYIRVSTDKQNTQNQQFEINQFFKKEGVCINKWVNETISSTTEALNRLKSEGKTLGRPKGSKNTFYKLAGKEEKIQSLINKGVSLPQIARMFRVDTRTLKTAIEKMTKKTFAKRNIKAIINKRQSFTTRIL